MAARSKRELRGQTRQTHTRRGRFLGRGAGWRLSAAGSRLAKLAALVVCGALLAQSFGPASVLAFSGTFAASPSTVGIGTSQDVILTLTNGGAPGNGFRLQFFMPGGWPAPGSDPGLSGYVSNVTTTTNPTSSLSPAAASFSTSVSQGQPCPSSQSCFVLFSAFSLQNGASISFTYHVSAVPGFGGSFSVQDDGGDPFPGGATISVVAASTATPTATSTPTATATPSPTASLTTTPTPPATQTPTPMPTSTATLLPTATATTTPSPTPSPTATASATPLPTATATISPTMTATATPSVTDTSTPTPTDTPTSTDTPTATSTSSPTTTPIPSPTPRGLQGAFEVTPLNPIRGDSQQLRLSITNRGSSFTNSDVALRVPQDWPAPGSDSTLSGFVSQLSRTDASGNPLSVPVMTFSATSQSSACSNSQPCF